MDKTTIIQEFDGYVTEVDLISGVFFAVISDLTNRNNPDEIAEIYISSLFSEDIPHIKSGCLITWKIGTNSDGSNFSDLRLQRNTRKDIARLNKNKRKAKKKAAILFKNINFD